MIPSKAEIQQHLGDSLAQVLFDYSHREVIKVLDSIPSVIHDTEQECQPKTEKTDTWIEKQAVLKAHIHHDILELGEDARKKFQAEIEITTWNKLKDEFEEKSHVLEAEKRFTIRRNMEDMHVLYEECFNATQKDLEKKLQAEWANAKIKHNKELQKTVVKTRLDTTYDVLRNIRPHMYDIITSLEDNFQQSLRAQKEKMIADFNRIMRKQHVNLEMRIKEIERKKLEALFCQRHELEIRNATDIIYVLCMERIRNASQVHEIHKHFEEQIKLLNEVIAKRDEYISTMKKKITKYRDKNVMLEKKLSVITKEFQRFINFALDAMPEHADFLLPLDLLFVNDTSKEDNKQEKK